MVQVLSTHRAVAVTLGSTPGGNTERLAALESGGTMMGDMVQED